MLAWGDELTRARPFGHVVDDDGTRLRVALGDGRRWTHRSVTAVLNRLRWVPPADDPRLVEADRAYGQQELTAITLSWLAALADRVPFVGRPASTGLSGHWRQPAEWARLIAAAGLRPYPVRLSSALESDVPVPGFVGERRALVVLGEVVSSAAAAREQSGGSALDGAVRAGLVRLAALADADTMSVELDALGRVAGADIVPDLRPGGRAAAERIAAALAAASGGA